MQGEAFFNARERPSQIVLIITYNYESCILNYTWA